MQQNGDVSAVNERGKSGQLPDNRNPLPQLHLYNSLTRRKDPFVPISGKKVKWYICGPTVYDSAHLGHARAYLSFDILRRVIGDYFGYEIQYVMNVTDVDDKIIKRARCRHLYADYIARNAACASVVQVITDVLDATAHFKPRFENETDSGKKKMLETMLRQVDGAVAQLEACLATRQKETDEIETAKRALLHAARDVLSEWLDAAHGQSITDLSVFDALSKTYEKEFFEDMARLNVLPADVLTRVSEYVPEVIAYVQRIIANGYGYETADGSVYFDTIAFANTPKHSYAKLLPEAFSDKDALLNNMRESEGELSMGNFTEKRNPTDFALWKSSKGGEPFWDSPWGKGRPGWHIECSAMASEICGSQLDIHAGGSDLKFPHHDNEIAQAEAYLDCSRWVNYFLHCGTLRIAGQKMSKSLKNFETIRDALKKYTARQLRILFLMHNWTDLLDYSSSSMERALQFEKITNEFFLLVKDYLRRYYRPETSEGYLKYQQRELRLMHEFFAIKGDVHAALCDSVDTRTVVEKIRELIALGNAYIIEKEKEKSVPNCLLLRNIAAYITWLLRVFGAVPQHQEIGFPADSNASCAEKEANAGANSEEMLMPYLLALADFREKVRNIAKEHKVNAILKECDRLRDEILPELGVRLEDRSAQTCVKLVDRETIKREQEQKKAVEEAKEMEKQRKLKEQAEREAAKRIPAEEMFRRETEKYSAWDDLGIPTHDVEGKEIGKKQRKKLEAAYEQRKKQLEGIPANGGSK